MNVRELLVIRDSDLLVHQVEVASYKAVTKKVVGDFVRDRIVCRFGVPESIITDNAANLNSDLMKAMCETFKIKHWNSTAYRLHMNGAVEAANKNIKKILRKMVDNYKHLPYSAVIPAEVEISSLRIIQEAELSDVEWIRSRYEQLDLIDGKRMNAVCHGQLYRNRMARVFNKKVRSRQFTPGQFVLKRIFPHQDETKGKFSPNLQGPYMVQRVLTGGALYLQR
ncbi:uncharacterized protein [Nicotiana tomentosiformis]|uniref:uncharacterized protein n=1 Tax=Nicotiana tomentosiformis TaxID=4098 RepID=UPI00388C6445